MSEIDAAGFMLLRIPPPKGYRGVDRQPFEPIILATDVQTSPSEDSDAIWAMYPEGWRRAAYRAFSESLSPDQIGDVQLIEDLGTALEIQSMIPKQEGVYEVLHCRVFPCDSQKMPTPKIHGQLIGYDVAYPGGDYYSAILNGLLLNPDETLQRAYGDQLNESGLLMSREICKRYLDDFRSQVASEESSDFVIFELRLPQF